MKDNAIKFLLISLVIIQLLIALLIAVSSIGLDNYNDNRYLNVKYKIDSLHTVEMDSIKSLLKHVKIYNDNVEEGLVDFMRAETLIMMEE